MIRDGLLDSVGARRSPLGVGPSSQLPLVEFADGGTPGNFNDDLCWFRRSIGVGVWAVGNW